MWLPTICLSLLWVSVSPTDYDFTPFNVTRTIAPGIAAVRSALTLDWLDAEDSRQRQVVQAYQTGSSPPAGIVNTDCVMYPRPAAGKIGRLLLEMLKNLEGDDGRLIVHLVQEMVEKHILVESTVLDSEPNLESLVKIPREMLSEPYHTFPRIIGMIWLTVTDPVTVKQDGWCAIKKVRKYLATTKPRYIAKHMKYLDPILARIRYIIEEFILNVTPLSMFPTRVTRTDPVQAEPKSTQEEILYKRKPINKRKTPTTTSVSTTSSETIKTPTEEYPEETTTEKLTYEETTTAETTPEETSPRETTTEEVTTEESTTTSTTTESTTTPTTTETPTTETTTTETTTTTDTTTTTTTTKTTTKTIKFTTRPTKLSRETPQWFNHPTRSTPNDFILQIDTATPSLSTNHIIRKHIVQKKYRLPKNLSGRYYDTMVLQLCKIVLCLSVVFVY